MADMVKFKRGTLAKLGNVGKVAGQILVCTDERAMYLDLSSTERIRIGDFQEYANWAAIQAIPTTNLSTTALYYATAENILAKYTGSGWNQINAQNDLAALGGVSQSVYDAKIKDLEDADQANADNISGVDERLKAAEEILKDVATGSGVAELTERVTAVEGKVATIEGDYLKAADKTELEGKITTAQTAADNAQGYAEGVAGDLADHEADTVAHITAAEREAWNGKTTMAEVEAKNYLVAADIAGKADAAQVALDIAAAVQTETDNRVLADDAIKASIGTVAEGKTVVKMIEEAQAAATYDDAEVRGLISDNADAIADEATARGELKTELEGKIGEKVAQSAYDTKVAALEGEDARLAGLISAMDEAYKAADNGLSGRIAALESDITGLSGAMHFKGVKEELPATTEGYNDGDTIIVGNKEYVVNGEAFVELGDVSAEVQRISDLEAVVNGTGEGEAHVDGLVDKVADNAAAIVAEKERAEAKEAELVKADSDNLQAAKDYADAAVEALSIGDYAKQADLENATGRITTAEGKITALETASATHALKTEVEAVSTELGNYKTAHAGDYTNTQIDEAIKVVADDLKDYEEAHASDYTNEQINNAIANAGHASATDLATHTGNNDIHVTTADKEKWNAAEQNAKDYSDGKLDTAKSELEGKITAAETAAKGHADTEVGKVQTALDTYKESNNTAVAGKADKATTLAGYGITDAMTKTDIEAMLTWSDF